MAIKHISGNFNEWSDTKKENLKRKLIQLMMYIGEMCLTEARNNGTYKDQTGNLRSSIGYVVLVDGVETVRTGFQRVMNGAEGQQEGQAFLSELIMEHRTKGIVLIVVAGMNYATYVEALNYNVLTSSELLAQREVPRMLKQLDLAA